MRAHVFYWKNKYVYTTRLRIFVPELVISHNKKS